MSAEKEQQSITGDGKFENDEILIAAASTITWQISDSGSDTATTRYFGMGRRATKLVIRADGIFTINKINETTPKSPITIGSSTNLDGQFSITSGIQVKSFELQTYAANISVKVFIA